MFSDKNKYREKLYEDLFRSEKFSDVTLILNDKKYPAHKFLLAAQSKFFQAKLYGIDKNIQELEITLKRASDEKQFLKILKYMYSGKMNLKNYSVDNFMDLMEMVHEFNLDILEKEIVKLVEPSISDENVYVLLETSNTRDLYRFRLKCLQYLCDNVESFCKANKFFKLPLDDFCDFLKLKPKLTELSIFGLVRKWLQKNPDVKPDEKARLLSFIEFSQMSVQLIREIIGPSKLFDEGQFLELLKSKEQSIRGKLSSLTVTNGKIAISYHDNYTGAVKVDKEWCIVVDLGKEYDVNHVRFTLADPSSYCIEFSLDGKIYFKVVDYLKFVCHKQQYLSIPEVRTRFIKIFSYSVFRCNAFHVSYQSAPKKSIRTFLCPQQNVATPKTAWAHTLLEAPQLLTWDYKEQGMKTQFVSIDVGSYKGIEVKFFQPYWLGSCRLRLWDFDGRKSVLRVGYKSDSKEELYNEITTLNWVNGWQHIEFAARPVISFIIEAQNVSKGDDLRLVHFEAPSQHGVEDD